MKGNNAINPINLANYSDFFRSTDSSYMIQSHKDMMKVKSESEVAQSCPTFCDPMDCSLPGSSVHGIFQARILDWVEFPSPGDLPNAGIEPRSPAL